MTREDVFKLVENELIITDATKRPFASTHEALGVALEKFDGFKYEIKNSHEELKANKLIVDVAIQMAGVMIKVVETLYSPKWSKK